MVTSTTAESTTRPQCLSREDMRAKKTCVQRDDENDDHADDDDENYEDEYDDGVDEDDVDLFFS